FHYIFSSINTASPQNCPLSLHDALPIYEVAREAVDRANLRLDDVDWLIPHQASLRILDSTARRLGFAAERVVVTVDRHANTSAASIPLALDVAVRDGRIKAGHKVLLEGVGGGFTWGAVLVQM